MRNWALPLVVLLATGCQGGGSGGSAAVGADRIAFASCTMDPQNPAKTLSCNLRTVRTDGTGLVQLTPEQSNRWDRRPIWSPDATRVAFTSCRYAEPGNVDTVECNLRVVDADGTNERVVASAEHVTIAPAWSPGGDRLAFLDCNATCAVTVADPYGTNVRKLPLPGLGIRLDEPPAWSPDGSRIVFSGRTADSPGWDLYSINADGSGLVDLTGRYSGLGSEWEPAWSPDGTRIVFVCLDLSTSVGNWNLYTIHPDGSHLQNLTRQRTTIYRHTYAAPTWIDGGSRIAFSSTDIYVMDADGTNTTNLTARLAGRHYFVSPSFSPDDSWFATVMAGAEDFHLSMFNASGSCLVKVPNDGRGISRPSWSPVETRSPATPAGATCLPKPPPGDPITAAAGRIAFLSDRGPGAPPNPGVFVAGADGTDLLRVGDTLDAPAVWSPDGTRLAMVRKGITGSYGIFVVNADGSGQRNLTGDTEGSWAPAWSPDGERIAFISTDSGGIDVIDSDGRGRFTLLKRQGLRCGPVWSPDGSRIAFCSADDNVYSVELSGGSPVQLTHHAPSARPPQLAYSPDGSRIVFTWSATWSSSQRQTDIYMVGADGSGETDLTNTPGVDQDPAWSPDSQWIAFSSDRNDSDTYLSDIYLMKPDGSEVKRLTYSGYIDSSPVWSPDGAYLAFVANRSESNIMVMRANGSAEAAVTTDPADDKFPAWQPR